MLTKAIVQQIHADIQAALRQVADKHGIVLSPQSKVKYTDTTFKFTAEFGIKIAGGGVDDPKLVRNAERFGFLHGLGTDRLGRKFNDTHLGDVTYVGMTSRDKAVVRAHDGKLYRYDAAAVARNINK